MSTCDLALTYGDGILIVGSVGYCLPILIANEFKALKYPPSMNSSANLS